MLQVIISTGCVLIKYLFTAESNGSEAMNIQNVEAESRRSEVVIKKHKAHSTGAYLDLCSVERKSDTLCNKK